MPLPTQQPHDENEVTPQSTITTVAAKDTFVTGTPPAIAEMAITGVSAEGIDAAVVEQLVPPTNPPYSIFTSWFLGSCLFGAVSVFEVFNAIARQRWPMAVLMFIAIISTIFLGQSAWASWRRVLQLEAMDPMTRRRPRRVLRTCIVIAVLFLTIAALLGKVIGQSGAEAAQLAADLKEMSTVGNRVSKARNAAEATIPSHVSMYKSIEPDVNELEVLFRRLKTELNIYDGKFPSQHQVTATSISNMETGLQRTTLLKKQIEVSKTIKQIVSDQQLAVWQEQMQPLLDREAALNKSK